MVCADDTIAFGVMVAFDALGIRVPEDAGGITMIPPSRVPPCPV